jgi:hypothetical protein
LAAVLISLSACAFGQARSDPWTILTSGGKQRLNLHTTHADLVHTFGSANVVERDGIEGFSGDMEYITALYPNDPERAIEIVWRDGENKTIPESMTIRGCKSRWKTVHGISLGISLKQLEELNGHPFVLAGFGWDYSGQITSWENGSLGADLDGGYGQIRILLDSRERHDVSEKELQDVSGDRSFSSHHPTMQKLNPIAYKITWEFPSWEQR